MADARSGRDRRPSPFVDIDDIPGGAELRKVRHEAEFSPPLIEGKERFRLLFLAGDLCSIRAS